jgi:xanthine dehydrogenase YagR molybdenum-binding subunit
MTVVQEVLQGVMKKVIALAPDSFIPGGKPDPLINHKHGLIGAPISRIDGPLKVAGKATFAAEFPLENLVYATLHYSRIARGRIAEIDTSAAEAAAGVVLVMTYRNAPRLKPMPPFMSQPKAAGGDDVPIMQDDQVHWNGQPVAVVLAETQEQADHAQSLIRVTYEPGHGVTTLAEAKANGSETGLFQGEPLKFDVNAAEEKLAAAPHRVDARYTTPRHNHNPIELHAATLFWDGDELRVHDASQAVDHAAWTMAQVFGIEEAQVHLTSPYVGGGFGSKTLWQHQILAAAAAKLARRPVRIMLSREGVFRIVGGRTLTEQRVAIGAQDDGSFDAIIHTGTVAMTPHNNMPEPFILPARSAYGARSFLLHVETVKLNMTANTFMRAPGESVGTFGLECAVDELAHEMGIDPIELRIRNEPEKDPTTGLPFSSRLIVDAWHKGAARFGWSRRLAPGTRREGDWLIGMGCATATYPYYRMPGGAARITLPRGGGATVAISAHEMGMGTATAQSQVIAERLGLSMEQVTFDYGDNKFPGTVLAGGSQQTAAIGAAVSAAYRELVEELIKLAGNDSPLAGLTPDEVGSHDGGLCKLDEPERRESYVSILDRAQRSEVTAEAEAPMPFELQHWSMHSHGAMFCELRVNTVTGEVRVSRFLGSFDCGRILNAKTAASQFRGGIIMGLGLALMEETQFDERTGRIANPSLAEYHVPVHLDVPEIDVIWLDEPDPHTPMGARGIGEIGITGVGAAVANAVFNATSKRIRDLPITLDKLL